MTRPCALITGAGNGLGKAISGRLAADGYAVALADIDLDAARAAADDAPAPAAAIGMDIRSPEQVSRGVVEAAAALGGLNVLVNCAGIELVGPLLDTDDSALQKLFDINVFGTLRVSRAAVEYLAAGENAAIVNISSAAGLNGSPFLAGYSMSKAAVLRMTEALAIELRPYGIRCNAICPALTGPTRMVEALTEPFTAMGVSLEQILAKQGGRMGRAAEVAALVTFLASSDAGLINGAHYVIDGGLTASVL